MASRYEPALRELAMEPDEERRLEMAAEIDRDAADLDERWDGRDAYAGLEDERDRLAAERDRLAAERDDAVADRDSWKERYADRFFDSDGGITGRQDVIGRHAADIRKESRPRGFAALWDDRID